MKTISHIRKISMFIFLMLISILILNSDEIKASEAGAGGVDSNGLASDINDRPRYNPSADEIIMDKSNSSSTYYLYVMKRDEADVVKRTTHPYELTSKAAISIVKDLNIRVDKDVYIYCAKDEPLAMGATIPKPNFKIKRSPYSKLTITIDYTTLDMKRGGILAEIIGKIRDTGKEIELYSKYRLSGSHPEINYDFHNTPPAEDSTMRTVFPEVWEWSRDGNNWLDASNLYGKEKLEELQGLYLYIRIKGYANLEQPLENIRCSKIYKIKLARPVRKKTIKIDVKKMTIPIKNGMEYAAAGSYANKTDEVRDWYMVLPYNNKNKLKTAPIMKLVNYVPTDKKSSKYDMYSTGTKVGHLLITDIEGYENGIYYRSAATAKKPASEESFIALSAITEAPQVTMDNVLVEEVGTELASESSLRFTVPDIRNYVDKEGSASDNNIAKYEYAILKKSDISLVDWTTVAWKPIKSGAKNAIKDTMRTKYSKVGTTAKIEAKITDTGTVFAIRRAGIRSAEEPILPSKMLVLRIDKSSGKYSLVVDDFSRDYKEKPAEEPEENPTE